MKLYNRKSKEELRSALEKEQKERITLSFYKYHRIGNVRLFRDHFYLFLNDLKVLGRVYVANEGINAQISIPKDSFEIFEQKLGAEILFLNQIRLNKAIEHNDQSFLKLIVRIRPKIVADGLNDSEFDVTKRGSHLSAEEVNALAEKEETVLVDMRNTYEWEVGHFRGAVLPEVTCFRDSLPVVEKMLEKDKEKDIVMYCTGGIRCEKASAYFLHRGFSNVHMIDGGIIEYSRRCKEQGLDNLFVGKNFVFDQRLGERISDEVIAVCHQCGSPCDTHTNCANDACHLLFIQCPDCAGKYEKCCSQKCRDFNRLPQEEQKARRPEEVFNGDKYEKGRYHAGESRQLLS